MGEEWGGERLFTLLFTHVCGVTHMLVLLLLLLLIVILPLLLLVDMLFLFFEEPLDRECLITLVSLGGRGFLARVAALKMVMFMLDSASLAWAALTSWSCSEGVLLM